MNRDKVTKLTGLDWLLIPEPFHLQLGVTNGDEATLKVGEITLSEVVQVLKWLSEDWTLEGAGLLCRLKGRENAN